ncbi:MAG: tetraacyldisaccharide 4'-kinase [Candidatus Kapabacteria bacterium]|nr:tetraacyldisaccharide 4'-kinase [Candidatus Kapabacteria bacterium]
MLTLLAWLYGAAVAWRNRRYDSGRKARIRIDKPVISIGNLSVGGSGKTPVTELVVDMLKQLRRRPAIVARGYKRRGRGLTVVHDGVAVRTDWTQAGDEPFLLATSCQVPVIVGPHKGDAAVHAAGTLSCDVIVVDDGFQHRDLERDIDIVLVDRATMTDGRLLPVGRLREPLTSLRRADVVMLMHPAIEDAAVRPYLRDDAVVVRMTIERGRCTMLATGADVPLPDRCVVLSGIARPERMLGMLADAGVDVVDHRPFPDHHDYTKTDIDGVIAAVNRTHLPVVTTAKDAVKLHAFVDRFVAAGVDVVVMHVQATIEDGAREFLTLLSDRITS